MPTLLAAVAEESKVRAFQIVSCFEIAAPSSKSVHENTRSSADCVRAVGVISWIVLGRPGKTKTQTKTLLPFRK
jgi:hypothetical protein